MRRLLIVSLSAGLVAGAAGCGGGGGSRAPLSTEAATPVTRPAQPTAAAPVTTKAPPATARPAGTTASAAASAAPAPARATPSVTPESWRPAWWIPGDDGRGGTAVGGGIAAASGMATEADVLAARRSALSAAMDRLERAAGKAAAASADLGSKIDTLQLPDGRYRAFILVSVPTP